MQTDRVKSLPNSHAKFMKKNKYGKQKHVFIFLIKNFYFYNALTRYKLLTAHESKRYN